MMDTVLAGYRWQFCMVYLDDIIVFSKTIGEHAELLLVILTCLGKAELKVKLAKCDFAKTTLRASGYIVNQQGVSPDPEKVSAVSNFPCPDDGRCKAPERLTRTRSFVGLCSYYRCFVKDFATLAKLLHSYINSGAKALWGDSEHKSFATLKEALAKTATLAFPDHEEPFGIHPDACDYGKGATLIQRFNNDERPLAFASRFLSRTERNYSITVKECLAMVWAFEKFHTYIWGAQVRVVTDHHALCWLTTKRILAGRLARWGLVVKATRRLSFIRVENSTLMPMLPRVIRLERRTT